MKNILMIATGGTIASKEGDLGLTPAVTGEELAASVPGIKDICHLEILQLMNIDSTNMRPRQWLMIRDAIMENYNHYDGFVILHGTDTMAYTAAALSYLIQDSVKPIVLTGSQKPMANPYTDAKINLFQSILYAADDLSCNVCIVFNGKVVAGTRGRKQRTRSFDAFDSMNFPELAIIRDSRIIRYYTEKRPAPQDLKSYASLNDRVFVLKLTPEVKAEIFDLLSGHYDAIILKPLVSAVSRNMMIPLKRQSSPGWIPARRSPSPHRCRKKAVILVYIRLEKNSIIIKESLSPMI